MDFIRSEICAPLRIRQYTPNQEILQVQPGSRLGPYEIVAAIGAGGMGPEFTG